MCQQVPPQFQSPKRGKRRGSRRQTSTARVEKVLQNPISLWSSQTAAWRPAPTLAITGDGILGGTFPKSPCINPQMLCCLEITHILQAWKEDLSSTVKAQHVDVFVGPRVHRYLQGCIHTTQQYTAHTSHAFLADFAHVKEQILTAQSTYPHRKKQAMSLLRDLF